METVVQQPTTPPPPVPKNETVTPSVLGLVLLFSALGSKLDVILKFAIDVVKAFQRNMPERAKRTKVDDTLIEVFELFRSVLPGKTTPFDVLGTDPKVIADKIASDRMEEFLAQVLTEADKLLPGEESILNYNALDKLKDPANLAKLISEPRVTNIRKQLNQ